jgi:hypothetical protein
MRLTGRLATEKVGALALLFILVNAADIGQTAKPNQMLKHINNPKNL